MNLVSTYRHNWKRTNVQLVSLACGLALATVAVIGGNELLRDKGTTVVISSVAQPAGAVFDPTDFGSQGIEHQLAQQEALRSSAAAMQDARGIGQPGEGAKSVEATLIDPTDFGSIGIAYHQAQAQKAQFGTQADAVYASEALGELSSVPQMFGTMVDAVYVIEGEEYLR